MDLQLRGKRALMTGSTAGIGFAAASGLFREGAAVIINGRNHQRVEEAVAKFQALGGNGEVSGIAADLSTAEGMNDLVAKLPEVDILVNNMGIFEPKPFEEIPDADWMRFFYVCSPLASATNGAALPVDGGVVRSIVSLNERGPG